MIKKQMSGDSKAKVDRKSGAVTILDVARETGVSVATVYRAVNNTGRINAKTRERILMAVERLGYKANPVARGLALRKRFTIMVILPRSPEFFWAEIKKGVLRAAEELAGFSVKIIECYHANDITTAGTVLDFVRAHKIDALVLSLVGLVDSKAIFNYAHESEIPVAVVNEHAAGQDCLFYYGPDNYQAGRMAAELIYKFCPAKTEQIGLIHADAGSGYNTHYYRQQGFMDYFIEKGAEGRICLTKIQLSEITAEDTLKALNELILLRPKLSALYFDQHLTLKHYCENFAHLPGQLLALGHEYTDSFRPYLQDGTITAILDQEKLCQGYAPIIMIYKYLSLKEKPAEKTFYTNIRIVIESNVDALSADRI